jgi:hypothetical protein
MNDTAPVRIPTPEELLAERRANQARAHAARVRRRIPLYSKAVGDLRAAIVAGENPETCWVSSLAPLNREERALVRREVAKRYAAPAERVTYSTKGGR